MRTRSRQALCRSLFLVLGVVPTLLVATWAVAVNSAGPIGSERRGWETRLSDATGLSFRITSVEQNRLGTHLHGVQIQDPETGATVAEVRRLNIRWVSESDTPQASEAGGKRPDGTIPNQRPPVLRLEASQPVIRSAQVPILWRAFEQHVLQAGDIDWISGAVEARDVILEGHVTGETYQDVRFRWEMGTAETGEPSSPRAVLTFRVPWLEMSEPAEVHIGRNRKFLPPQTEFHLKTGPTPLPCSIFAEFLPVLSPLGSQCRFQGEVQASATTAGWLGRWQGAFHEVDLESLVSTRFPHTLRGVATVGFEHGTFRSNRLLSAKGWLDARDGVIGQSLLDELAEHLGCTLSSQAEPSSLHSFAQLNLAFAVGDGQLQLHGNCAGVPPGVIVTSRKAGVMLREPQGAVAAVALVRALVPDSLVQVPATQQTHWLLDALPLPEVVPLPLEANAAPPSSPLRFSPQ